MQRASKPELAPKLYLRPQFQDDLNAERLTEAIHQAFKRKGMPLAASATVSTIAESETWLVHDPESTLSFDIRADDDEMPVRSAATYTVEVQNAGTRWLIRDTTNVQTFLVQKNASGSLEGQQLIATMALKKEADENLEYLDIACEPEGFIYVLSYLRPGDTAKAYRLDIYNPDGSHLTRTPKNPDEPGVNAAKIAVDHWRTLFTLNYESYSGPGGRTEPSISQWAPSPPTPPKA
ncbi:MAG: hypothetical protein HYR68_05920 [Burkholderiales bacterium]|nr:hypothetical protein [Burkholderiales bacterium]